MTNERMVSAYVYRPLLPMYAIALSAVQINTEVSKFTVTRSIVRPFFLFCKYLFMGNKNKIVMNASNE